jgi:hypothetical protein
VTHPLLTNDQKPHQISSHILCPEIKFSIFVKLPHLDNRFQYVAKIWQESQKFSTFLFYL